MENRTACEKDTSKQEKKPRKRMKAVLKKIREQMEFYFSDSNLLKDRFLKKKMDEDADKYVDLEIFMTFNRIRAMTEEIEILRKALSNSTLLKLNDDKTRIKRTTQLKDPKDVDDRTVYVECLPFGVDHDWVRRVFSGCGHVLYVSLPKYRSTGDPKGFAFVEFQTVDEAHKACEMLNNPPADASDHPGHFPRTSKTLTRLERHLPPKDSTGKLKNENHGGVEDAEKSGNIEPDSQVQDDKNLRQSAKKDLKRHRQSSECSSESNEDAVSRKKPRVGDNCDPPGESEAPEPIKEQKVKYKSLREDGEEGPRTGGKDNAEKRKSKDTENSPPKKTIKTDSQGEVSSKKAKKRKPRQRKNKEKEVPEIRVISKHNWLALRNEYIALQKSHMSKLKKSLVAKRQEENGKTSKEKGPKTELVFVAGAIVEVKSERPLQRSALRAELSKHGAIAYMDMKDGLLEGHVRCVDGQSASNILQASVEGHSFRLLDGEEESKYWDKLKLDRENKFSTKTKQKKRGTQKLIDRGERAKADVMQGKHTVFVDE